MFGKHAAGNLRDSPTRRIRVNRRSVRARRARRRLMILATALMLPTFIIRLWFLSLLALGIIAAAVGLGRQWMLRSWTWDPVRNESVFAPNLGWNENTAILVAAI